MCDMDHCEKPTLARGLCGTHYTRWWKHGDPNAPGRYYAEIGTCAHDECSNSIRIGRKRPRKYCCRECWRTDKNRTQTYRERPCEHCGSDYVPKNGKQRWCWTCLGDHPLPSRRRLMFYDVSAPEWAAMVARYDGMCWLCREHPATAVDHDHVTGRVRGALCPACNASLHERIDSGWLARAIDYLGAVESAVVF